MSLQSIQVVSGPLLWQFSSMEPCVVRSIFNECINIEDKGRRNGWILEPHPICKNYFHYGKTLIVLSWYLRGKPFNKWLNDKVQLSIPVIKIANHIFMVRKGYAKRAQSSALNTSYVGNSCVYWNTSQHAFCFYDFGSCPKWTLPQKYQNKKGHMVVRRWTGNGKLKLEMKWLLRIPMNKSNDQVTQFTHV